MASAESADRAVARSTPDPCRRTLLSGERRLNAGGPATIARMAPGFLQIGEVATLLDLSIPTIRHWDEAGIAVPSARSPGGFRLYTPADVQRIRFIKRFRPIGFGLDAISEVLAARDRLADAGPEERAGLIAVLSDYIAQAEERYVELRAQVADAEAFITELRQDIDGTPSTPRRRDDEAPDSLVRVP